ncbi:MAG: hypothetical protein HQK77_01660 [Desulfobacterales bacterium]|nr:hypothetical protein [Desulfobacterales bacterium]
MESEYILIVYRKIMDIDSLKKLSNSLYWDFQIKADITHNTFQGIGYTVFQKGHRNRLQSMGQVFKDYEIPYWIIQLLEPKIIPHTITGFTSEQDQMIFESATHETFYCKKGDRMICLMTDISGNAIDKICKRHEQTEDAWKYRTILDESPLLDVYVLSETEQLPFGMRFFSETIQPWLPNTSCMSKQSEIHEIVQKLRYLSGNFYIDMCFGFGELPKCEIELSSEPQTTIEHNMNAFLHYGNLLLQMDDQQALALEDKSSTEYIEKPYDALMAKPKLDTSIAGASSLGIPIKPSSFGDANWAAQVTDFIEVDSELLPLPPPPLQSSIYSLYTTENILKILLCAPIVMLILYMLTKTDLGRDLIRLFIWVFNKGIFFFIASVASMAYGLYMLSIKRMMDDLPTSKARSVSMGMMELKGYALRKFNLVSPMTLTPCVYYHFRKYRKNQKDQWYEYASNTSGPVRFYLKDDTGKVEVDPDGAKFEQLRKETYHGNVMLTTLGLSMPIPPHEKWIEELIVEASPIYVLGYAIPKEKTGQSLKERINERLRRLKGNYKALMAYDVNKNGRIDPEEWEAVVKDVEDQVLKESLEDKKGKPVNLQGIHTLITCPPFRSLPYIIASTRMESKIAKKLRFRGIVYVLLSFILAIAGFWIINYMHYVY